MADLIDPNTYAALKINTDGSENVSIVGGFTSAGSVSLAAGATVGLAAGSAVCGYFIGEAVYNTSIPTGTAGAALPLQAEQTGRLLASVGNTVKVAVTPTITAGAYTAGEVVGGLMQFSGVGRVANGTGLILSASMASKTATTAQFDLILFSSQPSTSVADQANISTVAAVDIAKISKFYSMTEWTAVGAGAFGQAPTEPRYFKCEDGTNTTSLWGYLVARAAITFGGTSDVTVTLRAAQD